MHNLGSHIHGVCCPYTLWFRFPASYRDYVSNRSDGFAASLLPLAMTVKEDLEIEGTLSPRLLHGMNEYQDIQHAWQPELFDVVNLAYDVLENQDPAHVSGAVGCAFSGGVDSFYTLFSHTPENEKNPDYRLTHALMINGFEIYADLDEIGESYRFYPVYKPMMDRHGVTLLVSTTNIMQFFDLRILKGSFGAVLASSALVLGRLFSSFFIASSYPFNRFFPDGSHLLLDHLMSSETLEVIHDAPTVDRFDKTLALTKWPEARSALRVCNNPVEIKNTPESLENCCRCEKCIRTMATLKIAETLDDFIVFPKALRSRDIWTSWCDTGASPLLLKPLQRRPVDHPTAAPELIAEAMADGERTEAGRSTPGPTAILPSAELGTDVDNEIPPFAVGAIAALVVVGAVVGVQAIRRGWR